MMWLPVMLCVVEGGMRGGGRLMRSGVFFCVFSYVALGGVLSPLLFMVVCCSMLSLDWLLLVIVGYCEE